jgi:hypothetical protein
LEYTHLLMLTFSSIRGTKASTIPCSRPQRNQWHNWEDIMKAHTTMRSLNLAKFLFTSWSTRSSLCSVQSQIPPHIFVFGLSGTTVLDMIHHPQNMLIFSSLGRKWN